MSYKMVVIDCDGTLIKHNGELHKENIEAINRISKTGVKFVIATGRNDILVKDYMDEIGFKHEIVIGCNGATIRDLSDFSVIKMNSIPKDAVREVINFCTQNGISAKMYTLSEAYSIKKDEAVDELKTILSHYEKKLSLSLEYKFEEDIDKLIEEKEFLKIVIIEEDEQKLLDIRRKMENIKSITPVISAKVSLDIVKKGVSKAEATKEYINMLGIKQNEVVAIGDSENDLELLKFAAYSVAMGNAKDFIKEVCDMVTLTNDEGGVAYALNKIFK